MTVEIFRSSENTIQVKRLFNDLMKEDGTSLRIGDYGFNVKVHSTGIYVKIRNWLARNMSSTSCGICGCRPSEMNLPFDVHLHKIVITEKIMLGCSLCHLRIKAMKTPVNVGVRLQLPAKYQEYGKCHNADVLLLKRETIKQQALNAMIITHKYIVSVMEKQIQCEKAIERFKHIQTQALKSNIITYKSIVSLNEKGIQCEKAIKIFRYMQKQKKYSI